MIKNYLKFLYVLLACYYVLYMIYALYKAIVGEIGSIKMPHASVILLTLFAIYTYTKMKEKQQD